MLRKREALQKIEEEHGKIKAVVEQKGFARARRANAQPIMI